MIRNNFWRHLRHFKTNSLLFKDFLLLFTLSSVIFLTVTFGFYFYYSGLTDDAVSVSNQNTLSRVRDFVDLVSREAEQLSVRIGNDVDIQHFLKNPCPEVATSQTVEQIDSIRRVLSTSSMAGEYLYAIELFSFENDYYVSSNGISGKLSRANITTPEIDGRHNMWVDILYDDYSGQPYLAYFQELSGRIGAAPEGLLAVLVDMEIFGQQMQGSSSRNYEEIFLLNEEDKVLYSINRDNIGLPAREIPVLKEYIGSEQEGTLRVDGRKFFVTEVPSEYKKWRCISFAAPEHYYGSESGRLWRLLFGSLLFSLVIAALGAIWIAGRMFRPVNLLLKLVQEENPGAVPQKRRQPAEFEIIISNILSRYQQNLQMKQQLLNKQIMLNKAQNIALQAQINPHFLYNTLENINWCAMALTGGSNEVSEMIVMLSRLLRFYMKTEETLISVRDEVAYAKLYMDILELRYNHAYETVWEIAPETEELKIVKVTLQPLLENAVHHGAAKDVGGLVKVRAYTRADCGVIEIINTGPAVTDAQIAAINARMEGDDIREDSSIGMSNVNRRIKLHFGKEYGLSVGRTPEGHTCVTVRIPLDDAGISGEM